LIKLLVQDYDQYLGEREKLVPSYATPGRKRIERGNGTGLDLAKTGLLGQQKLLSSVPSAAA